MILRSSCFLLLLFSSAFKSSCRFLLRHCFFVLRRCLSFSSMPVLPLSRVFLYSSTPCFSLKDLFGFFVILFIFSRICFFYPWILGDPENFLPANPLVTPVHIQPEWYFLMAYAILRSIPNKLGGVVALALSIAILLICPFIYTRKFKGFSFYPLNKLLF